jgi:hypothetical protein
VTVVAIGMTYLAIGIFFGYLTAFFTMDSGPDNLAFAAVVLWPLLVIGLVVFLVLSATVALGESVWSWAKLISGKN